MSPRDAVAASIIHFEGGEVHHPNDRGGWTRFGLTFAKFQQYRPGKTEVDFRALTRDDVIDILCEEYALKPGYARIHDARVRWAVIDFAIHSGPPRATRALQRAAGATPDGIFGPDTEQIVNLSNGVRLFERLIALRLKFWAATFQADRSQLAFAAGWIRRAATLLEGR